MKKPRRKHLTPQQRDELFRRLMAGERATDLAREFGVSRSAVSHMKFRRSDGSRAATAAGSGVAVRLSPAEIAALNRLKQRAGYSTNSAALRSLLRMAVGMLEFDRQEEARLAEIQTELHKIGVNVNQIALAANRGRLDLVQHQWQAINELRRSLPEVRTYLKAVVDEQRRKGIRLYEKFGGAGDV
ncbi:plasmid mobilization relaxosome protein MobC [uncultured Paracoccus sp.]|uniref:plasmid mobilization relaxosome protein MobC n=1 Tax=uncultured Paracoccus sp. TaxID=189685 RepID=UPI00262B8434|nr:plasmid mobilization relaxosome protein MobC [uncultured Paracoccus sp.]